MRAPKMYGAVTVGERGQIVIPMNLRKSFHITAGDKLVVFAKEGGPIALVPADEFSRFLDEMASLSEKIKMQVSQKA